jgi:hypothetical protein
MYQRDVPKILSYVKENGPDGLMAVGAFVLSTIQTPLSRTKVQVADIKKWGIQAPHLWGSKRAGYRHLLDNRVSLYQKLVEAPVGRSEALLEVIKTPGLGLVKSAFLLQCLGYETACMDSHNIKRYGLDPNSLKVGKVTQKTLFKKVDGYVTLCDSINSSQGHWDDWCAYVANNRMNKSLPTADRVSAFHYEAIAA